MTLTPFDYHDQPVRVIHELTARAHIAPTPATTYDAEAFTATEATWTLYVYDSGMPLAVTTLLSADYEHSVSDSRYADPADTACWPQAMPQPPAWLDTAARQMLTEAPR